MSNSQKLETTQLSIIRLMNKQIVVYSYNGILLSNKLVICVTWMHLKVRQKKTTLFDSIYKNSRKRKLICNDIKHISSCL